MAHAMAVGLDACHQPLGLKGLDHGLAAGKAIHAGKRAGRVGHAPVLADDLDTGQVVTAPDLEIVGVVGRGDLEGAGAGGKIHIGVADNGNFTVHQRQGHRLGRQVGIAFIVRVQGHGRIAQHGFRPGGGHGERAGTVGKGVTDMVEVAVEVLVLDFQIGKGRVAAAAPVDDVVALIDQAFVVELDEHLAHGPGEPLVHGEAFAVPVARGTQALELVDDGAAVLLAPFPDGFDKLLAAQLMTVAALGGQFFLHHVLGGDAGMVGAGHPQDTVALQAAVTAHDVLHGVVQGMAHVQDAGDVGWGNDDRIGRLGRGFVGGEQLFLFPVGIPALFNILGGIALVQQFTTHGGATPCDNGPVAINRAAKKNGKGD
ncbi:conserved hypothetical protein [Desulfosarcina cetonica]|nr:conserved hypothetical protein [Desulfosarcina cetonica]